MRAFAYCKYRIDLVVMFVKFLPILITVLPNHRDFIQVQAESISSSSPVGSKYVAGGNNKWRSSYDGHRDIVDWIVSEGGFVNSQQEIRSLSSDDIHSPKGVFAKERIEKGDLLLSLPWKLLIRAEMDEQKEMEADFVIEDWYCKLVNNLSTEMKIADDSKFAPYIKFLNGQDRGQVLDDYSEEAKELFLKIIEPVVPRFQLERMTAEKSLTLDCDIENDPVAVLASVIIEQRSEDDFMVPYYDMYNHRNGKWLNTWIDIVFGDRFNVFARKTIEAGQEIYNSYNQCNYCDLKSERFDKGTLHIFHAYGFVESFPQRWQFGDRIKFDLDEQTGTDQLIVSWSHMEDLPNDSDDVENLSGMIYHVKSIKEESNKEDYPNITQSEWDSIWNFQDALLVAIENAYISVSDLVKGDISNFSQLH